MVPLAETQGEFQARVIVAKLGSAGILAEVRGASSVYPSLTAQVWVEATNYADARELVATDTDDVFAVAPDDVAPAGASRWVLLRPVLMVVALVVLGALFLSMR
jgi:hypothetical protein